MDERLQEYIDSRGQALRVDRAAGVIRGVKILGLESQNGRTYPVETLAAAAALYEGAKVNVNHPKSIATAPRDYQDRIGAIHHVALRANEGLFADLHFNPEHTLAGQLAWDAEHAPENVGFSHNVLARTARRGERVVVEAITKVQSVDLVADPATTRGLFESADGEATSALDHFMEQLTADDVLLRRRDLVESLHEALTRENARLRGELDAQRAAQAVAEHRAIAERLLSEYKLPSLDADADWAKEIVSEEFVATLVSTNDESAMRRLVEARAKLVTAAARAAASPRAVGAARTSARDQNLVESELLTFDAKKFVTAIT